MNELIPMERIENKIFFIRGHKVMLDWHLAELYGVTTKALKQAVRRNIDRFPEDFMFKITLEEVSSLRSQIVTLENKAAFRGSKRGKHSKYLSYVFTENGVAMLSSVLRSNYAIKVNIQIIRAFTRLRQVLASHKELLDKFKELKQEVGQHGYQITAILEAIRKMVEPEKRQIKRFGFRP